MDLDGSGPFSSYQSWWYIGRWWILQPAWYFYHGIWQHLTHFLQTKSAGHCQLLLCVQTEAVNQIPYAEETDQMQVSDSSKARCRDWSEEVLETWKSGCTIHWTPHSFFSDWPGEPWCIKILSLESQWKLQNYCEAAWESQGLRVLLKPKEPKQMCTRL